MLPIEHPMTVGPWRFIPRIAISIRELAIFAYYDILLLHMPSLIWECSLSPLLSRASPNEDASVHAWAGADSSRAAGDLLDTLWKQHKILLGTGMYLLLILGLQFPAVVRTEDGAPLTIITGAVALAALLPCFVFGAIYALRIRTLRRMRNPKLQQAWIQDLKTLTLSHSVWHRPAAVLVPGFAWLAWATLATIAFALMHLWTVAGWPEFVSAASLELQPAVNTVVLSVLLGGSAHFWFEVLVFLRLGWTRDDCIGAGRLAL